jgi:serine/threonine-protein kinase/endoribonuclease IRE1
MHPGGSSGWQAPEQLQARGGSSAARQTRAMDVFSLGCITAYCLTGGQHPFGESYQRDTNILRGKPNLSGLAKQPEASNLVAAMLAKAPESRPGMAAVLRHPLWWGVEQKLGFLVDVSDRWGGGGGMVGRGGGMGGE